MLGYYEKLSSDRYKFEVTQDGDACNVTVFDVQSGKTLKYYQASASAKSMINHMNSLTDSLLEQAMKKA